MSIAHGQRQTFLHLLATLRPHWRSDPALPARLQLALRGQRGIGARDRRLYRELIFTTLRHLPWVETLPDDDLVGLVAALAAETPATRVFRATFARPELLAGLDRAALLPAWLREECPTAFTAPQLATLLSRAPLWVRLQTATPATIFADWQDRGWRWQPSTVLPEAVRLLDEVDVTQTEPYVAGQFEVQDLGSQLLLAAVAPSPGGHWLDACAGAGGKTLQLARLLGATGRIVAHDIRPAALDELRLRAQRAGSALGAPITVAAQPTGPFDGVLVDAPCSGSGTWRRAPHLKWTTTPATIARVAATQRTLLDRFAAQVRPGGQLVYATCSLCRQENAANVAAFLDTHPDFAPAPLAHTFGLTPEREGLTIWPAAHDTDGFFVARLRRRS